jgi:hypothetical protein
MVMSGASMISAHAVIASNSNAEMSFLPTL